MAIKYTGSPILRVKDSSGTFKDIIAICGKSAYQYAVEGGYKGTEEEFMELLANPATSTLSDLTGIDTHGIMGTTNAIVNAQELVDTITKTTIELAEVADALSTI